MMRRREFIALVSGAAAARPIAARAQRQTPPVIGLLAPGSRADTKRFYDGIPAGMRERGYSEGRDYVLESRYAEGDLARLPTLAEELLRLNPQVIVTGTQAGAVAAKRATAQIPIVGINMFEPVKDGLIQSESRPGGNVTGTLQYLEGLTAKQLELARDVVPTVSLVGVLANANNTNNSIQRREAEATAAKLGVKLTIVEIRGPGGLESAFRKFASERANIVSVSRDATFMAARRELAALALASRLPTIYGFREHVESGGLVSYGIDLRETYRRAAYFVDRILKGEKPADLPTEFPTKLELVINAKTAKALGLSLPPSLVARADEVIE